MVGIQELPQEVLTQMFQHLFARTPPVYCPGGTTDNYTDELPHPYVQLTRSCDDPILQTCWFMYKAGIKEYRKTETRRDTIDDELIDLKPLLDDIGNGTDRLTICKESDLYVLDYLYQKGHQVEYVHWKSAEIFKIHDRSELMTFRSFVPEVLTRDPDFRRTIGRWSRYLQNIPRIWVKFKVLRTRVMCLENYAFHQAHADFNMDLRPCNIETIVPLHSEQLVMEPWLARCTCEAKLNNEEAEPAEED